MTLGQSAYLIYLVDWAGPDRAWESEGRCLVSQAFRRVFFSHTGLDFRLLASFLSYGFSVIVAGLSLGRWSCGSTVFVNSPQFTLVLHEIGPSSIPSIPGGGWTGTGG